LLRSLIDEKKNSLVEDGVGVEASEVRYFWHIVTVLDFGLIGG
jgi:hypothetical protein